MERHRGSHLRDSQESHPHSWSGSASGSGEVRVRCLHGVCFHGCRWCSVDTGPRGKCCCAGRVSRYAARPPDGEHHYGHQQYETLVSLMIAEMMTFGAVEIVQQAVHGLQSGESPDLAPGSFVAMLATISVNLGGSLGARRKVRKLASDMLAADAMHTGRHPVVARRDHRLGGVDNCSRCLADAITHDPWKIMTAVLATSQVETARKPRARSAGGHLLVDIDITVDPQMTARDAHEVASAVERSVKRVAGSETHAGVGSCRARHPAAHPTGPPVRQRAGTIGYRM